jgi:hypothetical protein
MYGTRASLQELSLSLERKVDTVQYNLEKMWELTRELSLAREQLTYVVQYKSVRAS